MSRTNSLPSDHVAHRGAALLSAHPPPAEVSKTTSTSTATRSAKAGETIAVGSNICIRYVRTGELEEYTLVPPSDADIRHNRISTFSPTGRALFGKSVGDIVEVEAPSGTVEVCIERIS